MTLATRSGSIIVKDGKLAENCGCCGGACCDGTTCSVKPESQCQGAGKFFAGIGAACNSCPLCSALWGVVYRHSVGSPVDFFQSSATATFGVPVVFFKDVESISAQTATSGIAVSVVVTQAGSCRVQVSFPRLLEPPPSNGILQSTAALGLIYWTNEYVQVVPTFQTTGLMKVSQFSFGDYSYSGEPFSVTTSAGQLDGYAGFDINKVRLLASSYASRTGHAGANVVSDNLFKGTLSLAGTLPEIGPGGSLTGNSFPWSVSVTLEDFLMPNPLP